MSPILTGIISIACTAQAAGSVNTASSKGISFGSLWAILAGTAIYLANAPLARATPRILLFGSIHLFVAPILQKWQIPQLIVAGDVTLSPISKSFTSPPISITIPEYSCPKVTGGT